MTTILSRSQNTVTKYEFFVTTIVKCYLKYLMGILVTVLWEFSANSLVTIFPETVTKNYANVTFDHGLK